MTQPEQQSDELASEYDLVVLGAGSAGMTAALVGAIEGLRVLLVEPLGHCGFQVTTSCQRMSRILMLSKHANI